VGPLPAHPCRAIRSRFRLPEGLRSARVPGFEPRTGVSTKEELLKRSGPDPLWKRAATSPSTSPRTQGVGRQICLIATVPGHGYQLPLRYSRIISNPRFRWTPFPSSTRGDLSKRVRERTRVVYEDVPAAQLASRETALLNAGQPHHQQEICGGLRRWRWARHSGDLLWGTAE